MLNVKSPDVFFNVKQNQLWQKDQIKGKEWKSRGFGDSITINLIVIRRITSQKASTVIK